MNDAFHKVFLCFYFFHLQPTKKKEETICIYSLVNKDSVALKKKTKKNRTVNGLLLKNQLFKTVSNITLKLDNYKRKWFEIE